jgi:hypothetical protein
MKLFLSAFSFSPFFLMSGDESEDAAAVTNGKPSPPAILPPAIDY